MSIRPNNIPLSEWLDPYVEGTPTCPTGEIFEGGVDIRTEYAPIEFGTKGPNLGVLIDGIDISNYFAAIGTASYLSAPWDDIIYEATVNDVFTSSEFVELFFRLKADGTFEVFRNTSRSSPGVVASGTWLSSGNPTEYEAFATYTESKTEGGGGQTDGILSVTNGMSSYVTINTTRELGAGLQRIAAGETIAEVAVTLTVRKIGGGASVTSNFVFSLNLYTLL